MNLLPPAGQERFLLQGMTCEGVESMNDRYVAYTLERLLREKALPLHGLFRREKSGTSSDVIFSCRTFLRLIE
jgi:hypothetical protein